MTDRILNVAMVGVGQWGANVLRNLAACRGCAVSILCDSDASVLARQARAYPDARPVAEYAAVLNNPAIDAVAIATDARSHHGMATAALDAGKHVFVEKPMAMTAADAADLVERARRAGRTLMVGHLLEHHPAFVALRRMLADGEIGDIYYMYTQRVNLGIVRRDENAWWSLAPHDVAVICRLFDAEPVSVSAVGQCSLQQDVEDVVFAVLRFADGRVGHVHVSWLDPHKIRKMTIVGSRKMIAWDDMSAGEQLRVYDKGADPPRIASYAEAIALRTGDIVIPKIDAGEPLRIEMQHFVDCVLDGRPAFTDGADGLRVVRVLEAGDRSLKRGGRAVDLAEL